MEIISRKHAKVEGLKYYFTNKACKRGHVSERYVCTGNCVECAKEQSKQYYHENKEQIKEHKREHNKNYYEANKEHRKEQMKQWEQANRYKRNANTAKRRAMKLQATPPWADLDKIAKIYEKCDELNENWGTDFEVDHVIPLQGENVCGLHVWENLQLLDKSLNRAKGNTYE